MISKVRIENFRSIEDQVISFQNLTALVGHNNSGKSNILRAISTCLGKEWQSVSDFSLEDFIDYDTSRDIVIELEFDPPLEYRGFKYEDPVAVPVLRFALTRYKQTTKEHAKGDLRLESKPLDHERNPVRVLAEAPKAGKQRRYEPLTKIPKELKRQLPLIHIDTTRDLAQQMPAARYSLLRRMLEDIADEIDADTISIDGRSVNRREEFERRLSEVIDVLRVPSFTELEDAIRDAAIENLGIGPDDSDLFRLEFGLFSPMDFFKAMEIWIQENGLRYLAESLGQGAQNAIVLSIFQAYERFKKTGAVFLIEEPEMYLHPQRARAFYDTLRRISEDNQVIYTTHSAYFTSVPHFDEIRIVSKKQGHRTVVKRSELHDTQDLRDRLDQQIDPERSELFFADHVILVEGPTEKMAFPVWAERLGVDLNRLNISVIEVGGKKSLPLFADVVASLAIPLTVVFDTDSSDFGSQRDEEAEFNRKMVDRESAGVRVIPTDPSYEKAYRTQIGEELFLTLTNRYPGQSKPIRAVRIARDPDAPIPAFCRAVFEPWTDYHNDYSEGRTAGE